MPITFDLSSLGSRLGAQILDVLITYGGATVFVLLLAWTGLLAGSALLASIFSSDVLYSDSLLHLR